MRHLWRASSCFVVVLLLCPRIAVAQCSSARLPERSGLGYGGATCSGTDPQQVLNYTRKWDATAQTACNDGGWKKTDQGSGVLTGIAHSICGGTPQGTPPICEGIVGPARDLGFFPDSNADKVATYFSDATAYNITTHLCTYGPNTDVTLDLPSQECIGEFCCGPGVLSECQQAQGDFIQSTCECNFGTPIIIDVDGHGFHLTSFEDGVLFDLKSSGVRRQMSWTAAGSENAFLALDRNGNGVIDGGRELFGNYTSAPGGPSLNGFLALAAFDSNGDGIIDARDPVYWSLLLWTDRNHDGLSDPSELKRLADSGIASISVRYEVSQRRDRFGNTFRFRAPVKGDAGPFAYDVTFLLSGETTGMTKRR